jgi:hypothetical protein
MAGDRSTLNVWCRDRQVFARTRAAVPPDIEIVIQRTWIEFTEARVEADYSIVVMDSALMRSSRDALTELLAGAPVPERTLPLVIVEVTAGDVARLLGRRPVFGVTTCTMISSDLWDVIKQEVARAFLEFVAQLMESDSALRLGAVLRATIRWMFAGVESFGSLRLVAKRVGRHESTIQGHHRRKFPAESSLTMRDMVDMALVFRGRALWRPHTKPAVAARAVGVPIRRYRETCKRVTGQALEDLEFGGWLGAVRQAKAVWLEVVSPRA